jgi:hypothetical protein
MSTISPSLTEQTIPRHSVLDETRRLSPEPRLHYINHPFEVPEGASRVGLVLSFHKERLAQLFVSLHSPDGFRGNRMNPGAKGDVVLELWVAPDDASEGGIPGVLPAGEWNAQLDIERLGEETEYRLQVYVETGPVAEALLLEDVSGHVVRREAGWYKGELHAHSTESDGKFPVDTVIQAAIDAELDYFALTDHFTTSQWRKLAPLVNDRMVLLHSCEITSHQGHANLHGLREWVDVYVDRPEWSMNQAADAVHAQDGLFCVNHPFSGDLGWRSHDFDWQRADLMEIYHNLEGANNQFHAPLWDHHLRLGRRIVGVGGIDSHNPFEGTHKLGQLVTWVHAPELSERGIVEGLRRGKVYVSRGPEVRYTARDEAENQAGMWESLPLGQGQVTFEIEVRHDEPLRLFIFKNGYPFDTLSLEATDGSWQSITFQDEPGQPAYYRLELHTPYRDETYPGIQWRDHRTMQALTNPIWVGQPD